MITPIHRIPQLDGPMLVDSVMHELEHMMPDITIGEVLLDIVEPDSSDPEQHAAIVLDWAMQLRAEFALDWARALHVASVLYYG